MNNKVDFNRMKALMNYGLQTENKKQYSSVEYHKEGADGKVYGIVREGTKYYIKIANDKKNIVKENFDYIGGFVNRKNNEYSSYANALKQFDLKMISLKEANSNGKNIIIESWNPDKNEELAVEATNKMRNEIMRQRQIMSNAALIREGKSSECCCKGGDPFCEKPCCDDLEGGCTSEKNNVKKEFGVNKDSKQKEVNEAAEPLGWHKTGGNAKETIADTYMDKSHGTEIGHNGDPFDKPLHSNGKEAENGVVAECDDKKDWGSKGLPSTPGVGEANTDKNKAPFNGEKGKQLDEALDTDELDDVDTESGTEFGPEEENTPSPFDSEDTDNVDGGDDFETDSNTDDFDTDTDDLDDDFDGEIDDTTEPEFDDETDETLDDTDTIGGGDDVESRLSSIESMLSTIMDKLSNIEGNDFEDDDLYNEDDMEDEPMDDMDDDTEYEYEDEMSPDEYEDDDEMGPDEYEDEPMDDMDNEPIDDEPTEDEPEEQIYESRSYRRMKMMEARRNRNRMINEENRLNDFGKHPAYRKHPMQLPQTGEDQNSHGSDWNHQSVHTENPYGEKIGSGAPFEIDPQAIENSIAECVQRILRKTNRRK